MREIYEELSWNFENLSKLYLSLANKEAKASSNNLNKVPVGNNINNNLINNVTENNPLDNDIKDKNEEVTIEKIREILAKKSRDGKTAHVKSLLMKFNANKLSEVKKEDYKNLMKESIKL